MNNQIESWVLQKLNDYRDQRKSLKGDIETLERKIRILESFLEVEFGRKVKEDINGHDNLEIPPLKKAPLIAVSILKRIGHPVSWKEIRDIMLKRGLLPREKKHNVYSSFQRSPYINIDGRKFISPTEKGLKKLEEYESEFQEIE